MGEAGKMVFLPNALPLMLLTELSLKIGLYPHSFPLWIPFLPLTSLSPFCPQHQLLATPRPSDPEVASDHLPSISYLWWSRIVSENTDCIVPLPRIQNSLSLLLLRKTPLPSIKVYSQSNSHRLQLLLSSQPKVENMRLNKFTFS